MKWPMKSAWRATRLLVTSSATVSRNSIAPLGKSCRQAESGVTPLSDCFIGLLGFISGLIYDEAFGRVRRLGMQLFAERTEGPQGRPEDNSLAAALKQASASRVADLVLKYGIGTRLGM